MMCSQSRAAERKWILYNDVTQYQDDLLLAILWVLSMQVRVRVLKLLMYFSTSPRVSAPTF